MWLQASLSSLLPDSPHGLGLGASFWVAPPAMSLLIKYVQKVRLLVATLSLTFDHVCIKQVIS